MAGHGMNRRREASAGEMPIAHLKIESLSKMQQIDTDVHLGLRCARGDGLCLGCHSERLRVLRRKKPYANHINHDAHECHDFRTLVRKADNRPGASKIAGRRGEMAPRSQAIYAGAGLSSEA